MAISSEKIFSIVSLDEKGQLTIPADYRRALSLTQDSAFVLVQIGEALVLVPYDEALAAVTSRLEAALHGAGVSVEELVKATTKARAEITREEFGDLLEDRQ